MDDLLASIRRIMADEAAEDEPHPVRAPRTNVRPARAAPFGLEERLERMVHTALDPRLAPARDALRGSPTGDEPEPAPVMAPEVVVEDGINAIPAPHRVPVAKPSTADGMETIIPMRGPHPRVEDRAERTADRWGPAVQAEPELDALDYGDAFVAEASHQDAPAPRQTALCEPDLEKRNADETVEEGPTAEPEQAARLQEDWSELQVDDEDWEAWDETEFDPPSTDKARPTPQVIVEERAEAGDDPPLLQSISETGADDWTPRDGEIAQAFAMDGDLPPADHVPKPLAALKTRIETRAKELAAQKVNLENKRQRSKIAQTPTRDVSPTPELAGTLGPSSTSAPASAFAALAAKTSAKGGERSRFADPPRSENHRYQAAAQSASVSPGSIGAMDRLARSALPSNQRTFEDVICDLVRPMLSDWIDKNLPGIVEREVRHEVEKVFNRKR